MTDAIKRAAAEMWEMDRDPSNTVSAISDYSDAGSVTHSIFEGRAHAILTAALSDREGMARVLYEDEHGSLPDDVWESLTAGGYSEKSPIGRAFRRIDALRAHLIGGEDETERRFQAHRAEVHRAHAEGEGA